MKLKWLMVTMVVAVIGLGPVPFWWGGAWAQEVKGLGIIPAVTDYDDPMGSWFVYELKPGEVVNDQVAVINLYEEPVVVDLDSVDATTTKEGAFSLKEKAEAYESVGGWVTGLPESLSLQSQERRILDFSLKVPEGTEPGDHLGGLVVQKTATGSAESQISVVGRTGVRIYVTVPGEVKKEVKVTELTFNKKSKKLKLSLKNTGNVRLDNLLVKLNLKSKWGWPPASRASYPQASIMLPGKEISLELPWENTKPILGLFDLEVELVFADDLKINKLLSFWLYDLTKLAIIIGSLGALVTWFKLTAKKRKNKRLERQKKSLERKQLIGLASKSEKVAKHGDDVDWLLKEIRAIIREELKVLAREGKLVGYENGNGSRKRLKIPKGLKLPRGVHSQAAINGNKKKFFFSRSNTKLRDRTF